MKPSEYDTVFCRQGSHAVPRAEINKLYSDDNKTSRACCNSCKDMVLAQREQAKLARNNAH